MTNFSDDFHRRLGGVLRTLGPFMRDTRQQVAEWLGPGFTSDRLETLAMWLRQRAAGLIALADEFQILADEVKAREDAPAPVVTPTPTRLM